MANTFTAYLNEELEERGIEVVRPVIQPARPFPQVLVEWVGFQPELARDQGEARSVCDVVVAVGYMLDDETDLHSEIEEHARTVFDALMRIPGVTGITPPGPAYAVTDPRLTHDYSQVQYRAVRFRVSEHGAFDDSP